MRPPNGHATGPRFYSGTAADFGLAVTAPRRGRNTGRDHSDPGTSTTLKPMLSSARDSLISVPMLKLSDGVRESYPPPPATTPLRTPFTYLTQYSHTFPRTSYKPKLFGFRLPTSSGLRLLITASSHEASPTKCCHWVSVDRKSTRLNSSHSSISYAVFCLKKKKNT